MDRKDIKAVPRLDNKDRKDLENVGRPNSDKSILTRQSEIQKKIIDEQESTKMSEQKRLATYLGISDDLIEAVKKVMKDKENEKDDDKDEKEDKNEKDDDEKEEKLSGKKTKVDVNPKTKNPEMDEELKGNQHKIDKNKNGKIDAHDFKLLKKEEVEQVDELSKRTLSSYVKKASGRVADKSRHAGDIENRRDISPAAKEVLAKHDRKIGNSLKGISRATDRLAKEEAEQIDELIGKGQLKPMMKQYTRERDAALKDKNKEKAGELDKKVTRATRMFGHNAALKAVRSTFPNIKRKDFYKGPKYKSSDVKEANDSEALAKINKIAADMKDMAKQPIKPMKKDMKLPHVNDGAPEMFKIKNESLVESIKKMIKEPKHLAANPNDAVKGVKSADAGRTHITD